MRTKPMPCRGNARAVMLMTAATALFSLIYASQKFAGGSASALQIMVLRYLGGLVVLSLVVRSGRGRLRDHLSARPGEHALRAACGCFGGVAIIHASANMPIVDATALGLLSVVFMIALGLLVFRERVGGWRLLGILLSVAGAGAMLMSRGAFQQFDRAYLIPASIATLGAVLIALESILIKRLSHLEPPLTVLLHVNAFGIMLTLGPALMTWRSSGFAGNLPFILLGPIAVFAQYLTIRAYRLADISVVGPVDYTWLIFAAIIGLMFFGEVPTTGTIAGAAVIGLGGLVLCNPKSGSGAMRVDDA